MDDVNLLSGNIDICSIMTNTGTLVYANKEVGLKVGTEETCCLVIRVIRGQNRVMKIANRSIEMWRNSNFWEVQ
jgi:hypothetical protein